jgi:ferredoxin
MPVLINFKICDNSIDCSGIEACAIKAFYWDEKKKTIAVDNSKCISCGICEKSCPVGAIRVAKNEKEYEKIKKEIAKDRRKISDLFVDRYGAQPIDSAFLIQQEKFEIQIIMSTKLAVVELFNNKSINCLLHSIPVREFFEDVDVKYRKIEAKDDSLMKKYGVKVLPSLLFFKNGKLIGKIEGYYDFTKEKEIKIRVDKIISKIK